MHAVQMAPLAVALAAVLSVAACASTGSGNRAKADASPAVAVARTPAVTAVGMGAESSSAAPKSAPTTNSPLVQAGHDPAIAGAGVDIRQSPAGFTPLPEDLEARVEQRWKLLIAGDGEKAYDFLTAGVRSSLNRSTYANDMRSRPVRWVSVEALDGQCEATSCSVRVFMTVKFSMQATGVREMQTQSAITERWIEVGGGWFHIPDQYLEGFAK